MRPPAAPQPAEECFVFHPRASNPELWRTTQPLVVRQRCQRHKGLVATWTAIHWLIVLYASSGRCAFGVREIAQEAGVGRNELAGPRGYIQRLVALRLLTIVGYEPVPGVKEPRPIYAIDLAELERQSLDLVPALLRERHLPAPPRPAPDPRQLALFAADAPEAGTVHQPGSHCNGQAMPAIGTLLVGSMHALVEVGQTTPEAGTGTATFTAPVPRSAQTTPATGTGTRGRQHENGRGAASTPAIGTASHGAPQRLILTRATRPEPGQPMPETGTGMPESGTDHARNRDVEREKERENEGGSERARTQDFMQELVAATTRAVLVALNQQGIVGTPAPSLPGIAAVPPVPVGQPALRASVAALWQGDRAQVPARERGQLTLLTDTYDAPTGGFGAYWLARAILLADMCLTERGRPVSLAYVRSILRRWAREASWGSDLPCGEDADAPARPPTRASPPSPRGKAAVPDDGADATTGAPPATAARADAPPAAAPVDPAHPAIAAYRAAFGRTPNPVQAEQMTATVTDLAIWRRVLTDWQANGWQAGAVAKMLDRYRKDAGLAAPPTSEPAPRLLTIHTYPGLEPEQRDVWIRRFHAAITPAEKRAVLARLAQEHPQ